jgi:hypothetical protein
MSNLTGEGFVEIRCCGDSVGYVNARTFTSAANERFCAIQQEKGNAWQEDAEAKELIADPTSYESPADGSPIAFWCEKCGAKFAWAGGRPVQISAA